MLTDYDAGKGVSFIHVLFRFHYGLPASPHFPPVPSPPLRRKARPPAIPNVLNVVCLSDFQPTLSHSHSVYLVWFDLINHSWMEDEDG